MHKYLLSVIENISLTGIIMIMIMVMDMIYLVAPNFVVWTLNLDTSMISA